MNFFSDGKQKTKQKSVFERSFSLYGVKYFISVHFMVVMFLYSNFAQNESLEYFKHFLRINIKRVVQVNVTWM